MASINSISKEKSKKRIYIIAAIIAFLVLCVGGIFLRYQQFTNKENKLIMLHSKNTLTDIYILGTIHSMHYDKKNKYSIADIQSVIDTVDPDILLVEVRQESVDDYDSLDGPFEMIFAWSYAEENRIPVKGIDWWVASEETMSNTTDAERDDHIYQNMMSASEEYEKILVLCGDTHRKEQYKRLHKNGYTEIELQDVAEYFNHVSVENFTYPASMKTKLEKKREYLQNGFMEEVKSNTSKQSDARQRWLKNAENMIVSIDQMINDIVVPNKLFRE